MTAAPLDTSEKPQPTPAKRLGALAPLRLLGWREAGPILAFSTVAAALDSVAVGLIFVLSLLVTSTGAPQGRAVDAVNGLATGLGWSLAWTVVVLMLVVGALRVGARFAGEALLARAQTRLQESWTVALFEACFALPYERFIQHHTAERSDLIIVQSERAASAVVAYVRAIVWTLTLVMTVALLWLVSPGATLVAIAAGGILLLVFRPLWAAANRAGAQRVTTARATWRAVVEPVANFRSVVLFRAAPRLADRARLRVRAWGRDIRRISLVNSAAVIGFDLGLTILVAGGLAVALALGRSLPELLPSFLLLVAAAYRIIPLLTQLSSNYAVYRSNAPSLDAVQAALEVEPGPSRPGLASAAISKGPLLSLEDVRFSHPGRDEILRGVSLDLWPGEHVGVVGPSGSGKSTMLDVLMGLLAPTSGRVARAPGREGGPLVVAYVPQQPFLLEGTVLENLALGAGDAPPDRARAAELLEFVGLGAKSGANLDLDTPIGEGGLRLSGGQRQRLSLARALYLRPDVLVLDEPTAALDEASERALIANLLRLEGVTMVLTTHRPGPLEACSRVVRIEGGRLVEDRARPTPGAAHAARPE